MTFSCLQVRARFGGYSTESLSEEERRTVREHLRACFACRGEGASTDPGLFFAAAGAEEVSSEEAGRILSAVRAGIALKSAERRLGAPSGRRRTAAAACAAAITVLTLALPGFPADRKPERSSVASPNVTDARGAFAPVAFPPAEAGGKQKLSADATIYDWNPGGEEPRVVWIVDRSLDI